MFFPYKDDNPRILVPYVTYAIIAVNVLVYLYQSLALNLAAQQLFSLRLGLIPYNLWGGDAAPILGNYTSVLSQIYGPEIGNLIRDQRLLPGPVTLLTSPFLHGGLLHLGGNMLFLYVFADNIESALGHVRFALFYVLTAVVAGLAHAAVFPGNLLPVIGASGAVSGVLGAYVLKYPQARIHVFVFIVVFFTTIRLPALVVLGYWFLVQIINGAASMQMQISGGTAWFEHIGGFGAGITYMAINDQRIKFPRHHGR
ncbi:MAG: rhomboid family intramembrane serine protease [Candidatus Marinimicrobia bacterium]|nr:rhomboid family intramembrane serine protease [Candidatus Neomarinimicrobiota bacterium]